MRLMSLRRLARYAAIATTLGAAACTTPAQRRASSLPASHDQAISRPAWLAIATPADRARIEGIDSAWERGLAMVRAAGASRRLRQEGALLDPTAALAWPTPAPGAYRCRTIRLAATAPRRRAYEVGSRGTCFIGGDSPLMSFTQASGSTRPGGYLHEDDRARRIFLGAFARRGEPVPPAYAAEAARDVAGILERIGDFRYRLVLPGSRGTALEIIELIPTPG